MRQNNGPILRTHPIRFAVLMAGVLLLSAWVRVVFLNNFLWDYDEGIHVLLARLLAAGFEPYRELFVSYPPLFVWSLELPWRIWGTIQAIQFLMVGYALLGIVAVGVLAFHLGDWLAGLIAATLISFSATYLSGSRAVMTEVPSVAVAAVSMVLAAGYYWSGRRGWLLASGLAMSASLMLKVLSPFVLGTIPLMLFVRQLEQRKPSAVTLRNLIRDGLIWGVGLLTPLLIILILYDARAMYRQVIAFRLDARIAYREDLAENLSMVLAFSRDNLPVVLAMFLGASVIVRKSWRTGWFVLVWLVVAVAFTLVQVPLREKHLPLLLPPMTVLAGVGLANSWYTVSSIWRRQQSLTALVSMVLAVLITVGYFWQISNEFVSFRQIKTTPLDENDLMLAEYLRRFTSPNDCVITDNPSLAFFAGRLVPPNLSEVSSARLRSGYLTYDELVTATEVHGCQVVAPVAKRLKRTRQDFVEWAKERFLGLWLYDGGTEVLLAQPIIEPQPSHPLQATFAGQVKLVGVDVVPEDVGTSRAIYLSLYWLALQPFTTDYAIFVHLRDGNNDTLVNGDHQPYNNLVPTTRWPVGQVVKETIRLDLPPGLPEGEYQIVVGLYSLDTLERLPVNNDTSGENGVVIPGILVQ